MSGASESSKPHGLGGFEETLKDFWASRPRRPLRERKIAGVAAGIGYRYGIDPVIVRVALVAATVFGGVGLALYLAGWLLFPGERDEVSPVEALLGRGRSSMSKHFTIALCVLFFPIASWAFAAGWFDGGGIIGLALLITALYLLHRSRGQFNRPEVPVKEDIGAAAFSMASGTGSGTQTWDPLGAAPLAWDLPDPAPMPTPPQRDPSPPAPRRNNKVGVATFALALLVAGVGVALGTTGADWFSAQHIIGLTLGVLGVGMVVGAFVHGGRGLIGWAIPLSIAGLITTAVPVGDYTGGFGNIEATPLTAAEVQPVYQHTAGDIDLNLTKLPAATPVTTEIRNGAGTTTVLVPATADVRYSCETDAGSVECFDRQNDGLNAPAVTGEDPGTDGPGGLQITLKVTQGAGDVEVRRG